MGYALRNDNQGWISCDSAEQCPDGYTYGETQPFLAYRKIDAAQCWVFSLGAAFTDLVPGDRQAWDEQDGIWTRGVSGTLYAIGEKKQVILDAGYVYDGHVYQIRDIDISNFQSVMLAFALGETNPHNGSWRDAANSNVTLTDTKMRALALGAITYHRDILRSWSAHKDAIAEIVSSANAAHPSDPAQAQFAATEAAETYNIDANWPSSTI